MPWTKRPVWHPPSFSTGGDLGPDRKRQTVLVVQPVSSVSSEERTPGDQIARAPAVDAPSVSFHSARLLERAWEGRKKTFGLQTSLSWMLQDLQTRIRRMIRSMNQLLTESLKQTLPFGVQDHQVSVAPPDVRGSFHHLRRPLARPRLHGHAGCRRPRHRAAGGPWQRRDGTAGGQAPGEVLLGSWGGVWLLGGGNDPLFSGSQVDFTRYKRGYQIFGFAPHQPTRLSGGGDQLREGRVQEPGATGRCHHTARWSRFDPCKALVHVHLGSDE